MKGEKDYDICTTLPPRNNAKVTKA